MGKNNGEEVNEVFNTIHLNDVKRMLGITSKGFRTVIDWCKKKKIIVFGQGKMKRILRTDWIACQKEALVQAVILESPNYKQALADKGIELTGKMLPFKKCYEPKSKQSQNFLSD